MSNIKDHLKDIDFRTRKERSYNAVNEVKAWYEESMRRNDERQARAFSAVLWLLMEEKPFKKYMLRKT